MPKLQEKNLIAQANNLIEAGYKITRLEYLLLVAMISLINPKDKHFLTFKTTVNHLIEILDIHPAAALREIDKVTTRLLSRVLKIETAQGWQKFHWVSSALLENNVVSLRFHDDLKPYLLELKKTGNFTQCRLGDILWFRSVYSSRIYHILREHYSKRIYEFEFSLERFREIMLGEQSTRYPLYKNFRKYVLDVAKKEFSQKDPKTGCFKSDLNFSIQTRRTGRKISHLIFTIKTQPTKPLQQTKSKTSSTTNNSNIPPIILAYEAIGVMRKTVQPYLKQRGEQALQNTLNKFNADKAKGKITKSEQGYLAYLLRVNAGQETLQDQECEQKEKNKAQHKEKEAQEQALKVAFIKEKEAALKGFFDTLEEGELDYIILDFEASALFEKYIKSSLILYTLYNMPEGVGMNDPDIKNVFHAFVIDRHLDATLNNFATWKEKKG